MFRAVEIGSVVAVGALILLGPLVGSLIGKSKGRGVAGFFLGPFAGVLGWVIVGALPRKPAKEAEYQTKAEAARTGMPGSPSRRYSCRGADPFLGGLAIASALVVLSIAGCDGGSDRSVEAFCSTITSEKARILEQFDETSSMGQGDDGLEVLAGLAASIQGLGELRTYTRKRAAVAPDEIRVEAELMAETVAKQLDAASDAISDPLGALVGGFMSGLEGSGPTNTVNEFARENCGEGI